MTAAPVPYWMIGRSNFEHGAAVRAERRSYLEEKDYKQDMMEGRLNIPHKAQSRRWKRNELQELWTLRYEMQPKATYDMLAERFGKVDTQVIVDALVELRRRNQMGEDMYKPFGRDDGHVEPKIRPLPKPKPKQQAKRIYPLKVEEKTKQIAICRGMGMKVKQISEEFGIKPATVSTVLTRLKRRHPALYNDLLEKGRKAKK